MKKFLLLLIIPLILLTVMKEEKELRVRVISNSNDEVDINIKNNIKDKLIEIVDEIKEYEYDDMITYINNNMDLISIQLNEICECNVSLKMHKFINKSYNDKVIDNKNVMTLLVIIKDGNGDNWWSTLYPNYLPERSTIKYESLLFD